jgi:Na+/H+ antiporter NhaC
LETDLVKSLEIISDKLGVAVEQLYPVFVNQIRYEFYKEILMFIVFMVLTLISGFVFKKFKNKLEKVEKEYEAIEEETSTKKMLEKEKEELTGHTIFSGIVTVVFFLSSCGFLGSITPSKYFNPEYHAIQKILGRE